MTYTYEESLAKITQLVEHFENNIQSIKKGNTYKEANVEDEFIKPFFLALNWNTSNEGITNLSEREFIVQAKGKYGKEPDYLLKLDNKPCFYIEAKHPKYDLFKEIKYIWQAYSYAYSTQSSSPSEKVDFSLLTDFEEFRFFDCTFFTKPEIVNNFIVFDWTYKDYVTEFETLWKYFERNNVKKGSLNYLYLDEKKIKLNRISPDKAFLNEIDNADKGWRITLARDIKKRNQHLTAEEITSIVQVLIDRFVFIKVLTDREIEDDFLSLVIKQVDKAILNSSEETINDSCNEIFTRINKTYNGSFFEKRKEFQDIKIGNKTLHKILFSLLPENSIYNFKVIPVEILGTIYEQFLGNVVVIKEKQCYVKEKPEVIKAGGVYYTPQFVVEFIVRNTINEKLQKCKSINDLFNIKICDPACGSGSFLLGAYGFLIQWCKHFYTEKFKLQNKPNKLDSQFVYLDNNGEARLTSKLKRDILKNCLFGVDIDKQAVEVTQLSLSLKALEETKREELYNEVNLFHEKVLPNLKNNIHCGNSLIDYDYNDGKLDLWVDETIKPFNWKNKFKEIFPSNHFEGFDVIIGNPPYIRAKLLDGDSRNYFSSHYDSAIGTYDIYILFIEKAFKILNKEGVVGFINPNKLFYADYGKNIREFIKANKNIEQIVNFNEFQIFKGITTYTAINIFSNLKPNKNNFKFSSVEDKKINKNDLIDFLHNDKQHKTVKVSSAQQSSLDKNGWAFSDKSSSAILSKSIRNSIKLEELCYKIYQGFVLTPTEVFPVSIEKKLSSSYIIKPIKKDENEYEIEKDLLVPIVKSSHISPYYFEQHNYYSIFPYKYLKGNLKVEFIAETELKKQYPLTLKYLKAKSDYLFAREKGKWIDSPAWYEFSRKQNFECQKMSKILVPGLATEARYTLADSGVFIDQGSYGIILNNENKKHELYILGLLNSKLLDYFLKSTSGTLSGGYYSYQTKYLNNLPIILCDLSKKGEKELYDRVVSLVTKQIQLGKEMMDNEDENIKKKIQDRFDVNAETIDEIVYKIYGIEQGYFEKLSTLKTL